MTKALLKARKAAGFTQKEIADLAGIDRSTYVHIERGDRSPSFRAAAGIAKALGKSIEELFSPSEEVAADEAVNQ